MRIALKGKGSDPTLFAHKEFEEMKAVREKTGLSQSVFATMIGVKVKNLAELGTAPS
ncbi:MAG: hypothetical protein J0665_16340 [Deltaproteobacteria bacterium]|nr:hypothetical protein [Deltaproteobacteria bacterium]